MAAKTKKTIDALERFDECVVSVSKTDIAVILMYLKDYANLRSELNLNCSITEDIDEIVEKMTSSLDG